MPNANTLTKPVSKKQISGKIYQLVWKWHFWAGLLVSPFLIVVSITGALYVFKDEIERYTHSELLFVEPGETTVGHTALEETIAAELPEAELHYISVSKGSDRSWAAFVEIHQEDGSEQVRFVYFDQYRGKILGHKASDEGFFRIVLTLHRSLLAGTPGRIIIEVATCWGIISMLAGLYLWWPRKKEKVKGVWVPRIRGNFRVILRDWHTVPGMYLSIFLLAIMGTGLFFTSIWGTGFRLGTALSGGFPDFYVSPPQSAHVEDHSLHTRISLDEAFTEANQAFPFEGRSYGIDLPHHDTDNAFSIITEITEPFVELGATYIDQYNGELLLTATNQDLPWRTHAILLFYPIHVGSIFGIGTKIIAVLSCLILTAMCATGVWLWWRRRPKGTFGAPKKTLPKTAPRWLAWLTIALAIFLPMVGLSLILIGLFQWIAAKTSQPRTV
ncbi:PepSY-associated TM helix family [Verrucomicrobiia bacterium DG1235]|nr:PepSY-associated TM helix family [Verrucomicrobiae bacterium DG1235]